MEAATAQLDVSQTTHIQAADHMNREVMTMNSGDQHSRHARITKSCGPYRILRYGPAVMLGLVLAACASKGSAYVGRWDCKPGSGPSGDFFDIKANNGSFLLTDETGRTYSAALDDKGTLVVSGVPLLGSLPLPIDQSSGELVSSASSCKRFAKRKA